ncbi:MAG TPA: hypothetical protein VF952_03080, partial [Chloroflexia bacterium]
MGVALMLGFGLWAGTAQAAPAEQEKGGGQVQSPSATYNVTNTNDSGAGSLRQAILSANANAGADLITFSIGSGQQTISPASPLPTITSPVTIDAATQPGYAGLPLIHLSGAGAGANANGFNVTDGGSTIKGLAINGFNGNGIHISGAGGNTVIGNCIGTNVTCDASAGNRNGVFISNSPNNYIGGAVAGSRNIISGNNVDGVRIDGAASTGNFVQRNYIGTDVSGNLAVGNLFNGITITSAANNTIGGTTAAARNLISGNQRYGVGIANSGATGNVVQGNYIGTVVTGASLLGNESGGVIIQNTSSNAIGTSGAGNLISGNSVIGVVITGTLSMSNTVQANTIGMDPSGANPNGNHEGILIYNASNNTIGGVWGTTGNLISGNLYGPGVRISGSSARNNVVKGNRIGMDVNGAAAQANGGNGVSIEAGASNNTIGGTVAGEGNLISSNYGHGIDINGSATTGNVVLGNLIGLNAAATEGWGNSGNGVNIKDAPGNTVGGTAAGSRNIISGNGTGVMIEGDGWAGVAVEDITARDNVVQGNYIGTNGAGNASVMQSKGVHIYSAPNNTIGGPTAAARNLISGNEYIGVEIGGPGSTGNLVQGNYIGTNGAGNAAVPNIGGGISVVSNGENDSNQIIGNVVSGNRENGISMLYYAYGTVVQGNLIGVTANGAAKLPNRRNGILINMGMNNTIGGTTAGTRNVISGNDLNGVELFDVGTMHNIVQGNYIGTNSAGADLGNNNHGVYVKDAPGNTVGGSVPGSGNQVAYNGGDGVYVEGQDSYQTGILRNSIHSNGGQGIDLASNGVTANDSCDADTGPNFRQNYPVLTRATSGGGTTNIEGTLDSADGGTYRVEFFSNTACDTSGYGEGQTYIGAIT